jgi:ectoine hydroxylase-related dioxygenase (phytanoyl-CoA dioxygenase family)
VNARPRTAEPELEEAGYVVRTGILDAAALERLRALFETACSDTSGSGTRHAIFAGVGHETRPGCEVAIDAAADPRVHALVESVLRRDFVLFQLAARDPRPSYGQQGLHADWLPRQGSEPWALVTAIFFLDEFTADNGATRVVPGSHRRPGAVPKGLSDPAAHHPDECLITGPAGTVLVFNGHLWHSGTRNRSSGARRALQGQYLAADRVPPRV